eukprot:gene22545-29671_t
MQEEERHASTEGSVNEGGKLQTLWPRVDQSKQSLTGAVYDSSDRLSSSGGQMDASWRFADLDMSGTANLEGGAVLAKHHRSVNPEAGASHGSENPVAGASHESVNPEAGASHESVNPEASASHESVNPEDAEANKDAEEGPTPGGGAHWPEPTSSAKDESEGIEDAPLPRAMAPTPYRSNHASTQSLGLDQASTARESYMFKGFRGF